MSIVSKVYVYHLQEPWTSLTWTEFSNLKLVSLAQEFWNARRYTKVASIQLARGMKGLTNKLNYAVRLTTSGDIKWWKNRYITSYFIADGCRNTSVGDVIEIDGEFYVVLSVGFEDLTDGRAPLVLPNLTKSRVPEARLNHYWLAVLKLGEAIEAVTDTFVADQFDDEVAEVGALQHRERMSELTYVYGQLNDMYTELSKLRD